MSLRDSFKEHYLLESSRRNELTSSLAVPIAILTAILGAQAVMAKELHVPLDTIGIIQLVLLGVGATACAGSAFFLFRALYGLAYAYVPTPGALSTFRDDLALYYQAAGDTQQSAEAKADAEAVDYLFSEYAKNADRNAINNDIKSANIHNANSALIAAVVMTALAGVAYVASSVAAPTPALRVEVINMPTMPSPPSAPVLAASAPPPSPPPPPPAVRPEPPPSRVVRESQVPPPPPPPPRR